MLFFHLYDQREWAIWRLNTTILRATILTVSHLLSRAVILQKLDLSTTATLGTEKSGQCREVAVSRDSTVPNIHFIDSIFKVSCLVRES